MIEIRQRPTKSALGVCLVFVYLLVSCSSVESTTGGGSGDEIHLVPVFTAVDSILQAAVDEELVAGAVLMVGLDGETAHETAFGYAQRYEYSLERMANPKVDPPEMTLATVFDLASLTKVFATTFGMMLLVDHNRIDLDAPVSNYLPAFSGVAKDSVTVRRLLTHSAGLYPWKPLYYHSDNKQDTYAYISDLELAYAVGQERHYSDLGFMLLGYIIEEVSGQPLDVFVSKSLYEPLGLNTTGYLPLGPSSSKKPSISSGQGPTPTPSDQALSDQAGGRTQFAATSHGNPFERKMVGDDDFGYLCDEDVGSFQGWRRRVLIGEVNDGNAFHANGGVAGHAGLFSSAADLQVLLTLLVNKGVLAGKRYLSEDVIDQFLTRDRHGHGLGWAMSSDVLPVNDLPEGTFGHTGFTGTYALAVPEYGLTIILLTNRQNVGVDSTGRYNSVTALRRQVAESLIEAVR